MRLPIKNIKSNPLNPRIIKDDKFKKLVQSLKDFPEMLEARELVLNTDHIVLGGNMRLKAAKDAGITELPVKIVDWSQAKQDEFIIKDNASFGEWDWSELANQYEAEQLDDWGIDVPKDFMPIEVEEDEAPEVSGEPAVSVLGEVYQLGRHRVMCGDSTDSGNVALLMDGVKADMVFTDPPYGISYERHIPDKKFEIIKNDDIIIDGWAELIDWNTPVYICTRWDVYPQWFAIIERHAKVRSLIVWDKNAFGLGDLKTTYAPSHEFILYCSSNPQSFSSSSRERDVWTVKRESDKYTHPTQKPITIPLKAITNSSKRGNSVLDLFGGSGSTLIACEQTDRSCYMMELDPKYVDVIRKRYWKFTHDNNEEGWQDGTPVVN